MDVMNLFCVQISMTPVVTDMSEQAKKSKYGCVGLCIHDENTHNFLDTAMGKNTHRNP